MRAVAVDDRRDPLPIEIVRASPNQGIALIGEVDDDRRDLGMTCEPRLHRVPVGGDHIGEVLLLREMEDLSYREISAVTQVPIGTVMSRLARARAALRGKWLQEAGGVPSAVR